MTNVLELVEEIELAGSFLGWIEENNFQAIEKLFLSTEQTVDGIAKDRPTLVWKWLKSSTMLVLDQTEPCSLGTPFHVAQTIRIIEVYAKSLHASSPNWFYATWGCSKGY